MTVINSQDFENFREYVKDVGSPDARILLLTNSRIIVELGGFIAWALYFLVLNYGRNIHKTNNTH